MFLMLTLTSLPRCWTIDASYSSRSDARSPRTRTEPPHSGTGTFSYRRSVTPRMSSRCEESKWAPLPSPFLVAPVPLLTASS
jgi:hypothetical protein